MFLGGNEFPLPIATNLMVATKPKWVDARNLDATMNGLLKPTWYLKAGCHLAVLRCYGNF
jgi:hypothetical protein